MLKTLRNAFKIKDVRKKLIYTFLMLVVTRIGSQCRFQELKQAFSKIFLLRIITMRLDFSTQ